MNDVPVTGLSFLIISKVKRWRSINGLNLLQQQQQQQQQQQ
jgi:hypothetical protein